MISREKSNFRLLHHKNESIFVSVYDINIEPCHQFWSENGCDDEDCGKFHICKKVILKVPHNKHTCKFSHEFSTSGNDKLIEENDLANLTNEQILILLRNRYPKVCKEYQTNQCTEGIDFCQKLHVCLNLVIGNCKKSEAICGLLHENGLCGSQSVRHIQEFNLENNCFTMKIFPLLHLLQMTVSYFKNFYLSIGDKSSTIPSTKTLTLLSSLPRNFTVFSL